MNYLTLLALAAFMFGCTNELDPTETERTLDLPKEYSYEISMSCFCITSYIGPHELHIREGEIINYELLSDEKLTDSSFIQTLTIESLVTEVNRLQEQNPVRQDIEMHPDYDFPISVYIDVSERIADEEWGYVISNFTVLSD